MSLPIITELQALNDKGIPFPVPSETEIFGMAYPGCQSIFQFYQAQDPMFSEYLYFMDLHGLKDWRQVAEIINTNDQIPEALSHRSIQKKVMIYLENYDLIKTWPDFDFQAWIDHNPYQRVPKFERLKLMKRGDLTHTELIINGDHLWVEDSHLDCACFYYLICHYPSPILLKKAWTYVEDENKNEILLPALDYTKLERVKLMFEIVNPPPQDIWITSQPDHNYQPVVDFLQARGYSPLLVPQK